jgi:hypothetical protein
VENSAESKGRWQYRHTWVPEPDDDQSFWKVEAHMAEYAVAGWELVSANAVQFMFVRTAGPGPIPGAASTSVIRHYFYWRKPAGD